MKTFLLPLLILISLPALAQQAHEAVSKRVALVIGNDAYQHARPLETAVNDATAVAGVLKKLDFETITLSNAGLEPMVEVLEMLKEKAAGASAVLVYYAGHGIESGGVNYLVPVDANLERELQLKTQALSVSDVLDELKRMNVPARMVILDCCRDNPLQGRSWLATRSTGGGGLAALDQDKLNEATLVVFSASPGKPALDLVNDKDKHSPFTQALLDELPQPGVHSFEVFGRVEESVIRSTEGRQMPRLFYNGSTLPFREFRFARGAPPKPTPDAPPVPTVALEPTATVENTVSVMPTKSVPQTATPAPVADALPSPPPPTIFDLGHLFDGTPYDKFNEYSRRAVLSKVQEKLQAAGLYHFKVDGAPGPGTSLALREWQTQKGLPVSGALDADTIQSMALNAEQETAPPAPQQKPLQARTRPQETASPSTRNSTPATSGQPVISARSALEDNYRRGLISKEAYNQKLKEMGLFNR